MSVTKEEVLEFIKIEDKKYDTPNGVIVTVEDVVENNEVIDGVFNIRIEKESSQIPGKIYSKVHLIDCEYNALYKIYLGYRYSLEEMLNDIMKAERTIDGMHFNLNNICPNLKVMGKDKLSEIINDIMTGISSREGEKMRGTGIEKMEWSTNIEDCIYSGKSKEIAFHSVEIKIECVDIHNKSYVYTSDFIVSNVADIISIRQDVKLVFVLFINSYNALKIKK